jgi:hypothetical protein
LDIPARAGEPGFVVIAGNSGGLSVVSCLCGVGIGVGVRFDQSTGVGRRDSGCAIAGEGGGGTYIVRVCELLSSSSSFASLLPLPSILHLHQS